MSMAIDATRKHQQACCVDHAGLRSSIEVQPDADDTLAFHEDVGGIVVDGRNDAAAFDEGQGWRHESLR